MSKHARTSDRNASVDGNTDSTVFRSHFGAIEQHKQHISANQRHLLPVFKHRMQFLYLVESKNVVVVVGEPGIGKSTQLPQYLLESGWAANNKIIACVYPEPAAAAKLAYSVSQQTNSELGVTVGYSVRFSSLCDPESTRLKYMTSDALIHECLTDPLLSQYSVIVVDEAQARAIGTDTLLALVKKIMKRRRTDLRLVIVSSSADIQVFMDYFADDHDVAAITVSDPLSSVDIHYVQEPCENYITKAVEAVLEIHAKEDPGNILVFFPDKYDIIEAIQTLEDHASPAISDTLLAVPLHEGLSVKEQDLAFDMPPSGVRKVVFATEMAETSATVPGIAYVIDSGFVKQRILDHASRIERLHTVPISKASADQRAAKAGLAETGKAYRLYTQRAFQSQIFPPHNTPETSRLSLTSMALTLKALGVENLVRFDYLQPSPPPELLSQALEHLVSLDVIDQKTGRLTADFGAHLAALPLDPELGVCLLNSIRRFKCAKEAIAAISMLALDASPFRAAYDQRQAAAEDKRGFMVQEGDVLTLVNVLFGFQDTARKARRLWCRHHFLDHRLLEQADRISRQLFSWLSRLGYKRDEIQSSSFDRPGQLQKCMLSGLFSHAACKDSNAQAGKYKLLSSGLSVDIHPSSIYFGLEHARLPEYISFVQATEAKKPYIRGLTRIEPDWLTEIAPHYWNVTEK
ncbi:hypothetical protein H4R99_004026 [Coemansia sp. RSA 1722]|nr:hypothetical protein IWW45_003435 [Coemansia sp. RSA 485]KAJ2598629.1 hypothetical protein H4R99_004026 [Coemansia sp. RSA 1722]